ncbi:MAG: hypothetical protein U0T83_02770 [Bacteriovoracaceae bacterium]
MPNILKENHFANIEWDAEIITCKGQSLIEEKINTEKRFIALMPFLNNVFKSEARSEEFKELYLEEMMKPENTLVLQNIIVMVIQFEENKTYLFSIRTF